MGARKETTSSTNVSRLNTSSHRKSKGDGSRNRAKPNVESEVDPEELDSPVPRKKARMIADNIDTEIPNVASPIPTDLDEVISDAPASPQASVTTKRESSKKKTTASEETAEKRLRRYGFFFFFLLHKILIKLTTANFDTSLGFAVVHHVHTMKLNSVL